MWHANLDVPRCMLRNELDTLVRGQAQCPNDRPMKVKGLVVTFLGGVIGRGGIAQGVRSPLVGSIWVGLSLDRVFCAVFGRPGSLWSCRRGRRWLVCWWARVTGVAKRRRQEL